jgi:hypothetical protein
MALQLVPKKKPEARRETKSPAVLLSDFAELIDAYGRLAEEAEPIAKRIRTLQEKLKPLKEAEKKLQAKIDELELDDDVEGVLEHGAEFEVTIGKRGSARSIADMKAVRAMMGDELFMKLATVTLKDIDAYLTPPEREKVLTVARTSRSLKLARRG